MDWIAGLINLNLLKKRGTVVGPQSNQGENVSSPLDRAALLKSREHSSETILDQTIFASGASGDRSNLVYIFTTEAGLPQGPLPQH